MGIIVYQVPILTEMGVSRGHAALLTSASGVAGIAGKLISGQLMDRRDASLVGSITLGAGGLGFLLLLESYRSQAFVVIAMLIIGYATGAKLQISAYLVSRYAGLRNFGVIFGFVVSMITLASSFGAVLTGLVRDKAGDYAPILIVAIIGSLVSALLIARLGAYPDWAEARADPAA